MFIIYQKIYFDSNDLANIPDVIILPMTPTAKSLIRCNDFFIWPSSSPFFTVPIISITTCFTFSPITIVAPFSPAPFIAAISSLYRLNSSYSFARLAFSTALIVSSCYLSSIELIISLARLILADNPDKSNFPI